MIKSIINQNTDVVTTKLKEIYMTCVKKRGIYFGGWLFAVWDGIILSVIPSAFFMDNWSHHCKEIRV
jgi:hypothetical protein